MISAIVLAAGEASRFGSQKLVASLGGVPLIRRTVENVLAAPVGEVVVVVGREAEAVRDALAGLRVRFAPNPQYREGMSTSIAAGIRSLGPAARAALIVLGDQPELAPEVVGALIRAYRETGKPIVVPVYAGTRGNPVLFDASIFPELLAVRGDRGGREVVGRDPARVHRVEFPFPPPRDVDTPADYEALLGPRSSPPAG